MSERSPKESSTTVLEVREPRKRRGWQVCRGGTQGADRSVSITVSTVPRARIPMDTERENHEVGVVQPPIIWTLCYNAR